MVAVLGPTAAGKSALAEHLAREMKGEIVNSDASAMYRELSIGVTKPSPEIRREIAHHGLDLTTLEAGFSLMDYLEYANRALNRISEVGHLPVVVGGSGLYARALLDGYRPPGVEVSPEIRERARAYPLEEAREKLRALDPEAHAGVDLANPRRVTRALELALAVGGPAPRPRRVPRDDLRILRFYLMPSKELLIRRIERRTHQMWEPWLEEVDQLEKKGLVRWLDLRKPIGYSSVLAFKRGEMTRHEAIKAIIGQTVKLAKKQRTWLKREGDHPFSHHFTWDHEDEWARVPNQALGLLRQFLS